jgi:hypothetical protein
VAEAHLGLVRPWLGVSCGRCDRPLRLGTNPVT